MSSDLDLKCNGTFRTCCFHETRLLVCNIRAAAEQVRFILSTFISCSRPTPWPDMIKKPAFSHALVHPTWIHLLDTVHVLTWIHDASQPQLNCFELSHFSLSLAISHSYFSLTLTLSLFPASSVVDMAVLGCFAVTYFFHSVVLGIGSLNVIQFLSLFIILGIGIDDGMLGAAALTGRLSCPSDSWLAAATALMSVSPITPRCMQKCAHQRA